MEKGFWSRRRLLASAIAGAVVAGSLLLAPMATAATDPVRPPQPPAPPPPPVGAVQICKAALGPGVTGAFDFYIRGGVPNRVSVEVGRCSAVIPVIVDLVAVAELPKAGAAVRRITAEPPERLVDVYLPSGQAIVTVARRGDPTVVTFGNVATRG